MHCLNDHCLNSSMTYLRYIYAVKSGELHLNLDKVVEFANFIPNINSCRKQSTYAGVKKVIWEAVIVEMKTTLR